MNSLTRIGDPHEIGEVLNKEFGVRALLSGDPRSEEGATIVVWIRPGLDKGEVRSRAASLCGDVYQHGFYVVPLVIPEESPGL